MMIHIKPKAVFIILAVFLAALATISFFPIQQSNPAKTALATFEEQPAKDKLLVYIFLDAIQGQSDQFYAPYYTISPTNAYYSTTVKEVQEDGVTVDITFSTLPYIGPHDTIGEDEITFHVTHSGEITPMSFKHLKSYPLPDNLRSIEKGALPPSEEK
ncbi:MAG: DUF3888 domain-containing protein [Intestinimonas sp.]|jgi:hypothetical protein|nr:DUF3888 domain-containing protein [Intestinimonas sp.]